MKRVQLDLWELLIFAAVLILATLTIAPGTDDEDVRALGARGAVELKPYQDTYGPSHYSRRAEEWLIRDFFRDERDGVFLDVGANHYMNDSNTYYLETVLGWRGLAVDALAEFGDGYRRFRPRTKFFALFVSDVSDSRAEFFVPQSNHLVASSDREFVTRETGEKTPQSIQVSTVTLNDLLSREGLDRLDFLTMDIEQAEPAALAGFDINRYRPRLVCIEGHEKVRQDIIDYFHQHGYVMVGKYLRADTLNLYFTPSGDATRLN